MPRKIVQYLCDRKSGLQSLQLPKNHVFIGIMGSSSRQVYLSFIVDEILNETTEYEEFVLLLVQSEELFDHASGSLKYLGCSAGPGILIEDYYLFQKVIP